MVTIDSGTAAMPATHTMQSKINWLSDFYSVEDLTKLSSESLNKLYDYSQPVSVKIEDLEHIPVSEYLINSPDGYVSAECWRNKGLMQCVSVTTKSGKTVTVSTSHVFELANDLWKYAHYLQVGDSLVTDAGLDIVTSLEPAGTQNVYDFEIKHENHRYFTNGLSSHNSGGGKSLFLANLGVNWALAGLNVLYLTFELSEPLVSMRIDSMTTGVSSREIFKNLDEVELKVKMLQKRSGHMQVKYMPSGKNCNDIRAYLKEYQVKTGVKPDVLLIDYLDLMMPMNVKVSPSDLFIKDKYVSEELRNLAMETQCITVTASQLNRCLTLDTLIVCNGIVQPIANVKMGDILLSNNEPVIVTEILPITKQAVYKITLKSGKTIKCSSKHLFPTSKGLESINNGLSVGSKLYSIPVSTSTKTS